MGTAVVVTSAVVAGFGVSMVAVGLLRGLSQTRAEREVQREVRGIDREWARVAPGWAAAERGRRAQ